MPAAARPASAANSRLCHRRSLRRIRPPPRRSPRSAPFRLTRRYPEGRRPAPQGIANRRSQRRHPPRYAERRNLEQPPTESWKTLVGTLIPVVSTLIVAGTLIFNIYQGRVTESEKVRDRALQHESDERKRLDQAMETLQRTGSISPSALLINTFTIEPYRSEARRVGRSILPRIKDYSEFTELFASVYEPLTEPDVPAVLTLLRSVNENLRPSIVKAWTTGKENLSILTADEMTQYRLYAAEQRFLSERSQPFCASHTPPCSLSI